MYQKLDQTRVQLYVAIISSPNHRESRCEMILPKNIFKAIECVSWKFQSCNFDMEIQNSHYCGEMRYTIYRVFQ